MVSVESFRQLALSYDETVEEPHFEKTSFRVNKKIFATLDVCKHKAILKLSVTDQSVFCLFNKSVIYAVSRGWGKQGWTCIELKKIRNEMMRDVLTRAYCHTAPKRLTEKYQQD
jgi:predicted DNA-binding protein (MmcQ/YjbR family)